MTGRKVLEIDVRDPRGHDEGREMVQARHLGQHAAGGQTRMEVGRSPHVGRVRGDVAGPRRDALCPLYSANDAAAGSLRWNSLRLPTRPRLSHKSFGREGVSAILRVQFPTPEQVCVPLRDRAVARPRRPVDPKPRPLPLRDPGLLDSQAIHVSFWPLFRRGRSN